MVNLSELYTLTKTTCLSICVCAPTREAHKLPAFILMLLPVGGNPLVLVSQMRSGSIGREGDPGGGGEPGAWLELDVCTTFPLQEWGRKMGRGFHAFELTAPWKSPLRDGSCTKIIWCVYLGGGCALLSPNQILNSYFFKSVAKKVLSHSVMLF